MDLSNKALKKTITQLNEKIDVNDFMCEECKVEHLQLREWLKELQMLRGYADYSRTAFEIYKRQVLNKMPYERYDSI